VRVAIRRIDGVESVEVSLEHGQASIRLRSGNRVTLAQLRQLVKNNGFNPREAAVTVIGELRQDVSGPCLAVTGTDGVLAILPDNARPAGYASVRERVAAGSRRPVALDGVVAEPQGKDARDRLTVHEVRTSDGPD
jgi:hypothetical protein